MSSDSTSPPIVCPVSKWYYRRYGQMAAMFLVFAVWFYKDGAWSWPKENAMAVERTRYEAEVTDAFAKAKAAGALDTWRSEAQAKGIVFNQQGEPQSWAAYAAKKGWPEKPKKRTETEIGQQFYWSGAMGVGLLIIAGIVLLNRSKKLVGQHDHLILPDGRRVNHADAFRIDARKWENKGLAYVSYREGADGLVQKAVIDCLKFQDGEKVYDQLIANFHGELIEKRMDADEPEEPAESSEKAS